MRAIAICQGLLLQFVISDTSILTTLGFPCFDIENDLCLCYTIYIPLLPN
jgi:predicted amidohydrolase